jgi:O-antigen ligase
VMTFKAQHDSNVDDVSPVVKTMPWFHMLYLTVCFFLAVHDPLASTWDVNRPPETYAATAGTGSLMRQLSFLMLALYALLHVPFWRSQRLRRQGAVSVVALLLCAWTFLSYAWSDSPGASRARLLGILALMLVASAICLRFRPIEIVRWIGLTTLCFAVTGIACELALGTFHPWAADYRFAGTLHPNEQGVNCALAAMASWYLWRRGLNRSLWGSALVAAILLTSLTKSRTALFSLLFALAFFQISLIPLWRKRFLIWSVAGALVVSAASLQWNGLLHLQGGVQLGRDASRTDTQSLTGRVPLWKELITLGARRRAVGYGYGGFWTPDRIADVSEDQGWGISASHSAYVEMLLALGPIGVALYTASLLLGIRRALGSFSESADPAAAFCGTVLVFILINGIADSGSVNVSSFLCFCSILSLLYVGFVVPGERAKIVQKSIPHTVIAVRDEVTPHGNNSAGAISVPSQLQELS